ATWKPSLGRHFVDSSRIFLSSGYSHSSATNLRVCSGGWYFSFSTKIGPRIESSSRLTPSGACVAKKSRCSFEKRLCIGGSPPTPTGPTAPTPRGPFIDPEHTNPPGNRAHSAPQLGRRR